VRGRRGHHRTRGRGSASTFAVVLVTLLGVAALVGSVLAGLLVAQRRAASAADLAALAGAGAVQRGAAGCAAAAAVAARNGAHLVGCRLDGQDVTVRVARAARLAFGRTVTVSSAARAGPGTASWHATSSPWTGR